ncbi:hypothetical protein MLD38_035397 [Melastoma candidum]|uniref:Uncharacterized protein n=1 Tax=Melastoma candidum TaxID=119954 RepID=A0ACB9LGW5_9MYRT|nr:hypothetical protein MLD38_035397 [Melastoma candidum]
MGEKADEPAKKSPDSGGNVTAVLQMDMHCEGCAKRVKRSVRNFDGVEDVQADVASGKLTVVGKIDPSKIRQKLQDKLNKKVDLISPQPAKKEDGGGNDKKSNDKTDNKAEEKKPEDKKPQEKTVVLKVRLHCEGCIRKIKKIILKFKGVNAVNFDRPKDHVMATGTMDVDDLVPYLKEKLKRNVEVVPPKKEEGGGGGGEKAKKEDGGEKAKKEGDGDKAKKEGDGDKSKKEVDGGEKEKEGKKAEKDNKEKGKESGGDGAKNDEKKLMAPAEAGDGEPKVAMSKMEYHGYGHQLDQPMFWNNEQVQRYVYASNAPQFYSHSYAVEPHPYHSQGYAPYPYQYHNQEPAHYVSDGYTMDPRLHAPQIFSDENPNACSVM